MQVLFAHQHEKETDYARLERRLFSSIRDTGRAFLYQFLLLVEIADSVEREALIRQAKHLPTEADLNFSRRFYSHQMAIALRADDSFRKLMEREKLNLLLDKDVVRLAWTHLKTLPEYSEYLLSDEGDWASDRRIAQALFEQVLWLSDDVEQHLEDVFPSWDEDLDMIIPRVLHSLKNWEPGQPGPWSGDCLELPHESREFVRLLLRLSLERGEELEALVSPRLANWELERVSLMDRVLLRMALAELLYFDTIPIKVSINEYIDIAKMYSTPRSKDFINGLLDTIMQSLREEGRIKKQGRGLVE